MRRRKGRKGISKEIACRSHSVGSVCQCVRLRGEREKETKTDRDREIEPAVTHGCFRVAAACLRLRRPGAFLVGIEKGDSALHYLEPEGGKCCRKWRKLL